MTQEKHFKFTLARIKALPKPDKGIVEYRDTECKKLACRVMATGRKSYVVVKWNGKSMIRVTIGDALDIPVSKARQLAISILTDIATGIDPNEEKRKTAHSKTTMGELLDKYLNSTQLKPRTVEDYQGRFQQGFGDWANKPVSAITKDMIVTRHHKTERSRDNKFRVLRLLMSYAVALEIIGRNPVDIISQTKSWDKPKRKTRIIPAERLQDWYKAVIALGSVDVSNADFDH